jgi:hypothetical protein
MATWRAKPSSAAGEGHQHADLAHAGRGGVVDVGDDVLALDLGHAAQRHVLADLGDLVGHGRLDRLAAEIGGQQRLDVIHAERGLGDARHHLLELGVLGDEVGLGVDLDGDGGAALGGDGHEALGGGAAGFLRGLGKALGAQPVDGGVHVTVGFGQRLLGVHHACAGLVAQFLHLCGCDRHLWVS